jgi:uncharacterized iron-regulated membrane protein
MAAAVKWRPLLARAHLWIGLTAALPLALIAASGAVLSFKDSLPQGPELRQAARSLVAEQDPRKTIARSLAGWLERHGDEPWSVVYIASERRAVHTVERADGAKLHLRVGDSRPLATAPLALRIEDSLYRLHTELLLGAFGKSLVKILAPAAAVSIVIGFVIWWPRRGAWRWSDLRPNAARRLPLLRFHMSFAALAALLIACHVFSGALLAHNASIRAWLRPFAPASLEVGGSDAAFRPGDFAEAFAAAQRVFPDGRMTQVARLDDGASARLSIKMRLPGERHPNGRSSVTVDVLAGRIESVRDARDGGAPAVYDDSLYPFHVARLFGPAHPWIWLLGALSLLATSVAGALAWLRR